MIPNVSMNLGGTISDFVFVYPMYAINRGQKIAIGQRFSTDSSPFCFSALGHRYR